MIHDNHPEILHSKPNWRTIFILGAVIVGWSVGGVSCALASSVSLAGVTPVLAAKAREIVRSCGSVVVSAVSRRGNRSNHPKGKAVDLQGNPSCIYAHLRGWPGGVSTDYHSAPGGKHVHVSYNPGGQEWGLRFVHRHVRRHVRVASR